MRHLSAALRFLQARQQARGDIAALAEVSGIDTGTYDGFLAALRARRVAFVEAGARATDHGHLLADTTPMDVGAAQAVGVPGEHAAARGLADGAGALGR